MARPVRARKRAAAGPRKVIRGWLRLVTQSTAAASGRPGAALASGVVEAETQFGQKPPHTKSRTVGSGWSFAAPPIALVVRLAHSRILLQRRSPTAFWGRNAIAFSHARCPFPAPGNRGVNRLVLLVGRCAARVAQQTILRGEGLHSVRNSLPPLMPKVPFREPIQGRVLRVICVPI